MAATIIMNKSRASKCSRIIIGQRMVLKEPTFVIPKPHSRLSSFSREFYSSPHCFPTSQTTTTVAATGIPHSQKLPFPNSWLHGRFPFRGNRFFSSAETIRELLAQVEWEKQREREARKRAGLGTADIDAEDEEDYMGVGPLIEKLEKEKLKYAGEPDTYEEPTDSESESESESEYEYVSASESESKSKSKSESEDEEEHDDEDDDEEDDDEEEKEDESKVESKSRNFTSEDGDEYFDEFDVKFERFEELLDNFDKAESLDDAHKWMKKIDAFEHKHFKLRPEYRVIGELMNRMKVATGKDRFILQQKLNRAIRLVNWKEAYDPNNPANYGVIQLEDQGPAADRPDDDESDKEKESGVDEDDDEEEFDDMEEKDDTLLEKLNLIDKKLEQKLAELDHTFGKKGRVLEEEIRDLAEERNSLIEEEKKPLYRKGFDVRLIDVNRTCKVTKGGQEISYTAMLACGNYHGVIGFAKAKGKAVPIALQKAYEKCFQNLHYVERHEEHTIAHAVQTSYKKTKVYLWPAPTTTGMKAGRTVEIILNLAGFKNIKSKVVGSRNPDNTVKALFKALNAIETPKEVQEKFGRTVVESYLL